MTKQQIEALSDSLEEFNNHAMNMYKVHANSLTEGDTEGEEIVHQYKVLFEQSTKLLNNVNRLLSENYPRISFKTISDGELFINGETASTSNSFINRTTSKEFNKRISEMAKELAKDLDEKAVGELINNDKTKENERD